MGGERSTSGTTYYDYAAVLFAPTSQTYTGSTSSYNPSCINSGQYVVFEPMAKLTMAHKDTTIANPAPNGTYKIVFLWHNDGSSGDGISTTINNLSITDVNAPEPLPEVNMTKYITLTVTQGDSIDIGVKASANNTPVKIKSGSWDTIMTVGSSYVTGNYTSQSTTMTIYGDIEAFYCGNNDSKKLP